MTRVCGLKWSSGRVWSAVAVVPCLLGLPWISNAQGQKQDDAGVSTLHVYTDLVQIPTLVLGRDRKPIKPIDEQRFFVSLDGGPKLRVTHARLEGNDQISLAFLLDLSQPRTSIMKNIDDAIASLTPHSLNSTDDVAIYALDCNLIRSVHDGLSDAASLKRQVDKVLETSTSKSAGCEKRLYLWDALAVMVETISQQPGRRVILAVTDGIDRGSHNSWNELRAFAQIRSVAIFGFVQPEIVAGKAIEPPFNSLCALTGGIVFPLYDKDIDRQFAWAMRLIRGRYIVEFPRPQTTVGGYHHLEITISKLSAIVRPTGAGVPPGDPTIFNDPTTVPGDPSHAPQFGNRKILTPD